MGIYSFTQSSTYANGQVRIEWEGVGQSNYNTTKEELLESAKLAPQGSTFRAFIITQSTDPNLPRFVERRVQTREVILDILDEAHISYLFAQQRVGLYNCKAIAADLRVIECRRVISARDPGPVFSVNNGIEDELLEDAEADLAIARADMKVAQDLLLGQSIFETISRRWTAGEIGFTSLDPKHLDVIDGIKKLSVGEEHA